MIRTGVQILLSLIIVWQAVGALRTFTPHRDRRRRLSLLTVGAFWVVVFGSGAAELFPWGMIFGIPGLLAALALFEWARRTIRGRFFSYINSEDLPQFLCASGPFRYVRHPFYSSYLLSAASAAIMFPNLVTIVGFAVAAFGFNEAARFEEQKFAGSPVAQEYAAYKQHTGRFLPHRDTWRAGFSTHGTSVP